MNNNKSFIWFSASKVSIAKQMLESLWRPWICCRNLLHIYYSEVSYNIKSSPISLVPTSIRDELKEYVVPKIGGEDLSEKIKNLLEQGKNVFVVGQSGLGKSLLMSYCYLQFGLSKPSCFFAIDRTQGPAVYETGPVLCNLREQIQRFEGLPNIEPPYKSESKTQWVWEKEYLVSVLRARTEVQPDQKLVIFLDGIDENYLENKEDEFILSVLKSLIQDELLKITWVFSSQLVPEKSWIKEHFNIIPLEGLGYAEARSLLRRHFSSSVETRYPDFLETLCERSLIKSSVYDPELLALMGRVAGERLKNVIPLDKETLQSLLTEFPLNPREKYQWLFSCFTNQDRYKDIPSLKEHAEQWMKNVKSIPYSRFLGDILAVFCLTRRPIPIDVLSDALALEDEKPERDFWGGEMRKFHKYPTEVGRYNKGMDFLGMALKDLRMLLKSVDQDTKTFSFQKEVIREAGKKFLDEELRNSARIRLFSLASKAVSLIRKKTLKRMPSYIVKDFIYFLSLTTGSLQKKVLEELLAPQGIFPEFLQHMTSTFSKEGNQWTHVLVKDLTSLLKGSKLPPMLKSHIKIILEVIEEWAYFLNCRKNHALIAVFIRNEQRLSHIWGPLKDRKGLLVPNGGYLRNIKIHLAELTKLEALSEGMLASGHGDGTIGIWDLKARKLLRILEGHISAITDLKVLPGGYLASCSDNELQIWDPKTGEIKTPAKDLGSGTLTVLPHNRIATTSGHYINILNTKSYEYEQAFQDVDEVADIVTDENGNLISGTPIGSIRIWNLETLEVCTLRENHVCPFGGGLVILPDNILVSIDPETDSSDNFIDVLNLWDIKSKQFVKQIKNLGSIQAIKGLSDGRLAIANNDGIIICDPKRDDLEFLSKSSENLARLTPLKGSRLASGESNGTIRIWDLKSRKSETLYTAESSEVVKDLIFFPDGRLVFLLSDGSIKIKTSWNGNLYQLEKDTSIDKLAYISKDCFISIHKDKICAWNIEERENFTLSNDSPIRFWRLIEEKCVTLLDDKGHLRLLDLATKKIKTLSDVVSHKSENIIGFEAFSCERIVLIMKDGSIRTIDINTGEVCNAKIPCNPDTYNEVEVYRFLPSGYLVMFCRNFEYCEKKEEVARLKTKWKDQYGKEIYSEELRNRGPGWRLCLNIIDMIEGKEKRGRKNMVTWVWNFWTGEFRNIETYPFNSIKFEAPVFESSFVLKDQNDSIMLVDADDGELRKILKRPNYAWCMTELPNKVLAFGGQDGSILIFDGNKSQILGKCDGNVNALIGLTDGRLASASNDKMVRIWNIEKKNRPECIGFSELIPKQLVYDSINNILWPLPMPLDFLGFDLG